MEQIRIFEDKMNPKEKTEVKYNNNHNHKRKGARLDTDVTFYNELGEELYTEHNELLLSGGLFVLSKLTNVNPPIKPKTLNLELGILPNESDPGFKGMRREHCIRGFIIGVGGCGDVFDTVVPVYYKERTVNGMIPFRKQPENDDLSEEEQKKYFFRKEEKGFINYYGKRFEAEPVIKAQFDEPNSPDVPGNVDELPDNKIINTYMQFTLKVSREDVRDYFINDGGGLRKARINTLGLVTGYPEMIGKFEELKGCQSFSKLNFNNEPLDNDTKELIVIYKIYI